MSNAFNQISRQAILDQCLMFFPELLPWVSWCYGSHPFLWHPLGVVTSQSGVQQGDPLGPMLFALVLHKLVASLEADDGCFNLLLNLWYLDDGVLAGDRSAVSRALNIIEELGPHLGLHINLPKCELFSRNDNSLFPPDVKSSLSPNLDVLGVPIGDYIHCSQFISERCAQSKALLSAITDVSVVDLHVSLSLLRICGSYSKLVHLARATPPSLCIDSLKSFDDEVRQCFASCLALPIPDSNWDQDSLASALVGSWISVVPSTGLGLHLDPAECQTAIKWWLGLDTSRDMEGLLFHGITTFVTPLPTSAAEPTFQCNWKWDMGYPQIIQTPVQLTFLFRAGKGAYLQPLTSQCPLPSLQPAWRKRVPQLVLQPTLLKPENTLPMTASVKNWAGQASVSAELYGHLNLSLLRSAARAILGREPMGVGVNSALESPIHQKVLSGLIQAQHFHILLESSSPANRARLLSVAAPHASSWLSVVPSPGLGLHLESNEFQMAIRWWLGVSVERGHGLTRDLAHTRPADILIAGWDRGKPAALDLTITSPLCSVILGESCYQAGAAALAAETRKLHSNGPKCQELG
eukprot:Em0006g596a